MSMKKAAPGRDRRKPSGIVPPEVPDAIREDMPTLVDEVELEVARLASARRSSAPPAPPPVESSSRAHSEHDIDVVWSPDAEPLEPEVLFSKYVQLLGPFRRVPVVTVPFEQLPSLSLDSRIGFLVALIDGASSIETLLDVAAMPPREVLHALVTLRDLGILTFRD
jgi:hypothetical protein